MAGQLEAGRISSVTPERCAELAVARKLCEAYVEFEPDFTRPTQRLAWTRFLRLNSQKAAKNWGFGLGMA